MSMSIRNQLTGTVTAVTPGTAMATVQVRLGSGADLTAAVTLDAVQDLGLAAGTEVRALVKATDLALATDRVTGLSIRNQLPGTVTSVTKGDAMAGVRIAIEGGDLTAAVTADAVADLGLVEGSPVVALVKSTEVALATV